MKFWSESPYLIPVKSVRIGQKVLFNQGVENGRINYFGHKDYIEGIVVSQIDSDTFMVDGFISKYRVHLSNMKIHPDLIKENRQIFLQKLLIDKN
jgi:hypothetical protein